MRDLLELLRSPLALGSENARTILAELAPALSLAAAREDGEPLLLSPSEDACEATWLTNEGLATLVGAAERDACARLTAGIEQIVAAGLPATFVFLFDELWSIGRNVCSRASTMLSHPYTLIEDFWAWRIPLGSRGWPPHRGISELRLDRMAPELLNTWTALVDVTAERACMHFVVFKNDPAYPAALATVDASLSSVRAAPVAAGTALVWNANILHWGGECSERACGPRVSASFSLCREDAVARLGLRAACHTSVDFRARLDSVARQIATYGHDQPDVSDAVLAWARATCALRTHICATRPH